MDPLQEARIDLEAEHADLDRIVASLDPSSWDLPTPAEGWSIRDQISHLAFFDEQARTAVDDPDAFAAGLQTAASDVHAFMNDPLAKARDRPPSEVLAWWRSARAEMLTAFEGLERGRRVSWFGPAMSSASFVSARVMETWAHGQDVVDALSVGREPSDRLRHIAFLGVKARPFSYVANGMSIPEDDVRVVLTLPSGAPWEFGSSESDLVEGSALDFCLVVTQRRHIADTGLSVEGPSARGWMSIAQCFAGPPGEGRRPGQFAGHD